MKCPQKTHKNITFFLTTDMIQAEIKRAPIAPPNRIL